MTNIFRFEKDGVTYAKGFYNQEGLSFYVLTGHMAEFNIAAVHHLGVDNDYRVEELDELPGEGFARHEEVPAGEFPCGHPRNGDDICSNLDCNDDLIF